MTEPRIRLRGVSKSFGRNRVLRDLSLDIAPGEIHALLGENGAGKSTLIKILAGVHGHDAGDLVLDGTLFAPSTPADAIRAGIATVFQEFTIVPHLSVAENVSIGRLPRKGGQLDWRRARAEAEDLTRRVGLHIDVRTRVGELPRSLQQLVEIAKAIGRDAGVFIFDEPTASLTEAETEKLFEVIRGLASGGAAIIYITHRMHEIEALSARVSVLRDGEITLTAGPGQATHDELLSAMTGRVLGELYPALPKAGEGSRLRVRDLVLLPGAPPIHLDVAPGEILGVAGLLNSGKDRLARTLGGAESPRSGEIVVDGRRPRARHSVAAARREGAIYYPADRKREGLVLGSTILRNMTMGALRGPRFSWGEVIRRRAERDAAQRYAAKLTVQPADVHQPVGTLSGGNQQKVLLARGLADEYAVHIFHDPTVGVDVGARAEVYRHIADVAKGGAAVVLVSSDLPEVLAMSHRVAVVRDGGIAAVLAGDERTSRAALTHFFGGLAA